MTGACHSRGLLWLLLAAALVMRVLVPQGYMPERDDAGTIIVKVCGAGHVLAIPLDQGDVPDTEDRGQAPCAFAGLGTPALPPAAVAGLAVPAAAGSAFIPAAADVPRLVARLVHPPARGPPPTA